MPDPEAESKKRASRVVALTMVVSKTEGVEWVACLLDWANPVKEAEMQSVALKELSKLCSKGKYKCAVCRSDAEKCGMYRATYPRDKNDLLQLARAMELVHSERTLADTSGQDIDISSHFEAEVLPTTRVGVELMACGYVVCSTACAAIVDARFGEVLINILKINACMKCGQSTRVICGGSYRCHVSCPT
jgi:hypothetical protein